MKGLIHIYTGDGKGKTTAAVGLSVRFAGHGGKVLFSQFLKDGSSGEIEVLGQIPGICVKSCTEKLGFVFAMNPKERAHAAQVWRTYLHEIIHQTASGGYGLLVLDEVIAAYNLEMIEREELLAFLKNKPEEMEVVLTGRDPADALLALADYISEIRKIRHPYDRGVTARLGIEQ